MSTVVINLSAQEWLKLKNRLGGDRYAFSDPEIAAEGRKNFVVTEFGAYRFVFVKGDA